MTDEASSLIVKCKSQEELDQLVAKDMKAAVLHYSYAMPGWRDSQVRSALFRLVQSTMQSFM
ncbi:hypothetical protein BGZ65_010718, partial [Modicella reniformis]